MKFFILSFLLFSAFCMLNAVTLEVSLDGTHQYTSIQAAVDAASNGDIIHVYPGRYYEHIDILEKTLTIQSQYAVTSNRNDIDNTIIDADFQSNCIRIDENSNVTADGFKMVNGIGYCYGGMEYYGGAVLINIHSIATIQNCIIKNNNATDTGGVYCAEYCEVNLSGNIIKDNGGYHRGGGVSSYNATITFDPVSLNSIFNNYGDVQDIFLFNVTCNNIVLDTLSVNITEPDGFFVSYYAPPLNTNPIPSISVQNSYFNQISADIYVSPNGDDNNDGLTPETALRTIAYATRMIQPDEQNPNTVYLLPGVYSKDLNNQFFPVSVQSNSKLLGAGETPEEVILGEEYDICVVKAHYGESIEIGNFCMRHQNNPVEACIGVGRSDNVYIHDMEFYENEGSESSLNISGSTRVLVENIAIHDINLSNQTFVCLFTYVSEVTFNNVLIHDNSSDYDDGRTMGINFDDSSITANNLIVTNNHQDHPGIIFQYANTASDSPGGNLNLSNFLMYNNTSTDNTMPMTIFINAFDPSFLNNMTIAHNTGTSRVLRLNGDFTMRNSILYNPLAGSEMHLWDQFAGDPHPIYSDVDVDYCLIRNGESGVDGADNSHNNLTWGSHNLDTDPLFRGDVVGDIEAGDFRWLQLTANSPCVDAGTPDTLGMNLPTVDIGGNTRVWGGIIDMGAWEYNATPNDEETVPAPPCNIVVSHFPNPVILNSDKSGCAFIEFTLPKKPIEKPTLEIYNIRGQKVRSIKITQSLSQLVRSAGLSTEEKQSGEKYSQIWDCRDDNRKLVTSGIYFYKVSSEGKEAIGKMMVLK